MALAERSMELLNGLPRGWRLATLEVAVEEEDQADRAALILAPAQPGRTGTRIRIFVHKGTERLGPTPEMVRRVLARLDQEGIPARLRLVGEPQVETATEPESARREAPSKIGLAAAWDALLERLPRDWSDLFAEVQVDSSDYLEQAALLLAPVNPSRAPGGRNAFRFRVARRSGYGAAPQMARRCLARLDEAGITGTVRVIRVLSDTHHVSTQGPVLRVEGRAV